jgi:hypothetical protein
LTGKCPARPVLQDEAKGHNMKEKYVTGKPRPFKGGELQNLVSSSLLFEVFLSFHRVVVNKTLLGEAYLNF